MRQLIPVIFVCILATCGLSRAQERRIPKPDDDDARSAQSVPPGKKGAGPAGTVTGAYGMLELQRCSHDGKKIICRFTFTPARQMPAVYQARGLFRGNALVD